MTTDIYFKRGGDLVDCLKWCIETEKDTTNLPANSPRTFTHLQQITADEALITCYGKGDIWLSRTCEASAVIGTELLFKGERICEIGSADVFKNYPLVMSTTKRVKVKLRSLSEVDAKEGDEGVTEADSYAGDLAAFDKPLREWKKVATILDGWEFRRLAKLNQNLSQLNKANSGEGAPTLLRFDKKVLAVVSAERDGALNGNNIITTEMQAIHTAPLRMLIRGRNLSKIEGVFDSQNSIIEIYVDDLEDPKRVLFEGNTGNIDMPILPYGSCEALTRGAMAYFYREGLKNIEILSTRYFHIEKLEGFAALQAPPSGNNANPDVLIEMEGDKMTISKREGKYKIERSRITSWSLEGKGDWVPYICKHNLLMASLETINKYIQAAIEEEQKNFVPTSFDEDDVAPPIFKVVELTQAKVQVMKKATHVLYFSSPDYKDCNIMLICRPLERQIHEKEN